MISVSLQVWKLPELLLFNRPNKITVITSTAFSHINDANFFQLNHKVSQQQSNFYCQCERTALAETSFIMWKAKTKTKGLANPRKQRCVREVIYEIF